MKIFTGIQKATIALLLGASFVSGTAVQAQGRRDRRDDRQERRQERREDRREDRQDRRGRNWDRYDNYGGSFQLRQTALNAGYNEGIKEGRKARNRRFSDFRNNSAYRNASKDYSSRLGNKALYQRYFRAGYENGYNDGYNGY
jgi:hypothetical protein